MSAKLTRDDFINRARSIHGELYDYSKSVYVASHTKLTITCKLHGDWDVVPASHVNGKGCPACGKSKSGSSKRKNTEDFIKRCRVVHGDTYDYSGTEYVRKNDKVSVICRKHGEFSIRPTNHRRGSGCAMCAVSGFDDTKAASLYILEAGGVVKVGITNRAVGERVKRISKSSKLQFSIADSYSFYAGSIARYLESITLAWLRQIATSIPEKFDGSTECFKDVDVATVIAYIENQINIEEKKREELCPQ